MSIIHVVAHHERIEAADLTVRLLEWAAAHGHEVRMDAIDAAAIGLPDIATSGEASDADLVMTLGGDGTTLRAVAALRGAPVPILAVNVGQLGYLAEVEQEQMIEALDRWDADGAIDVEERMMLDVAVARADGPGVERLLALNEAVVEKQEPGHTVRMLVHIDGAPFTSYAADGLIVSTPTGSTAYALSARGPVVSPRHRALLLTPVSPHMLFDRSLVLGPDEAVVIEILGHRPASLTVDGRSITSLAEGDRVEVTASHHVARFLRFGPRRFHQILKAKFGLADR
jgi:NAD+ kinase